MQLGEKAGLKPASQLRNYFGEALLELSNKNEKVVVVDGDLSNSTGAHTVRKAHPDRFFNIGIAESNLIGIAAGLASAGYIPFVSSFPSFVLCNAYDQIRLQVSIGNLNVKLVGSHSGITTGREGPPPMSIEDFALTGGLPPFTILVPSDPTIMHQTVQAAAKHIGPVYIRSSRYAFPFIYPENNCPFEIGKAIVPRQGNDVTVIACGIMVSVALDAAGMLADEGIEARVLDMHTLRPMDKDAIVTAAKETGAIVTAEEHLIRGGMGSVVAQIVTANHPVPMRFVGLDDTYADSGSMEELMEKYGLTAQHIVDSVKVVLKVKTGGK